MARDPGKPADDAAPLPSPEDTTGTLSVQAQLARDERSAALRALAGRLAHQIRNPLAAVRAACSSLRSEIDDPDQRETLDLTLQEIERMLSFVKATVQAIPDHREPPQTLDASAETADVVRIVGPGHAGGPLIQLADNEPLYCTLPRDDLRVAVYSVLDHLAGVSNVDVIQVAVTRSERRALIRFTVHGGTPGEGVLTTGMAGPAGWMQPVGLLVAERFARDQGGCLMRSDSGDTCQTFTLDLPCADV